MSKADKYNPVHMFSKYMELIYAKDELWDEFQFYLRDIMPSRSDEKFFEHHRKLQAMDIWRQMLDSMGGGWPLVTFAAAGYILFKYQAMGHDLEKERRTVHRANIKAMAEELLQHALTLPDGSWATTGTLLRAVGYDIELHENDLFAIHAALFKAAEKAGIELDMSKHDGLVEGLPYNLDFAIRYDDSMTKCPKCESRRFAPILYGMPAMSEEMEKRINNQEIYLAGCRIPVPAHRYHCFDCGFDFGLDTSGKETGEQ